MAVNYTPDYESINGNMKTLKPFRFWCQKVLPLVYDDSLSYYELLNKVVQYLNDTMENVDGLNDNVNTLDENVRAIYQAYNQLQDYVNNYFDNLNVQNEINNKLDEMATDGTLSTLISTIATPLIPGLVSGWLEENVEPTTPVVDSSLSISGAAADAKKTGDEISAVKNALMNLVITSDAELNRIIKKLYIPSSVTIDLSTVNRVTVYNGFDGLYGFRMFNSSNTRLLDFTKNSNISGVVKVGQVYAEIGDLSIIDGTSKNYYCNVYESAKDMKEFTVESDAINSAISAISEEFSEEKSYLAGQYIWYNGDLRFFTKNHTAGVWIGTDTSSVSSFRGLSEDVYNIVKMFANMYSDTLTYEVGDYCTLNNRTLYRCKTAITTPESFTAVKWERVFLTDFVKLHDKLIKSLVITTDPELNRIIKRLYIPSTVSVDLTSVTRVTVYNGFSNLYGFRFFNASNERVLEFAKLNVELSGYESVSNCYAEIGDLSIIGATSKNYYCSVNDTPKYDTSLYDDYIASLNTSDNSIASYSPTAQLSQGENKGDDITVMTYNVAHYNNDVAAEIIPDSKIHAIINTISTADPDIICVQEDRGYIDSNDVRETLDYLYLPQYPYATGAIEATIRSKMATTGTKGRVVYSNGRWLAYAVYEIGNKTILVCSTHPIASSGGSGADSADSIAARLIQYTEMFEWINGTTDLDDEVSGLDVHVPTHTHVVIGIDANCITADDKSNLASLAAQYNYLMANGGRLGWLDTCRSGRNWISLDNIIVSDNVIINCVNVLSSKYTELYSDHVPMVAKLTLIS